MAASRRGVWEAMGRVPISVSYSNDVSCWHLEALVRDPISVSFVNDVSCWHLLRLRQGGENVADVSGNGAAFPDVLETKGRNHDGTTEERTISQFV